MEMWKNGNVTLVIPTPIGGMIPASWGQHRCGPLCAEKTLCASHFWTSRDALGMSRSSWLLALF
jgi:hypothetical protein